MYTRTLSLEEHPGLAGSKIKGRIRPGRTGRGGVSARPPAGGRAGRGKGVPGRERVVVVVALDGHTRERKRSKPKRKEEKKKETLGKRRRLFRLPSLSSRSPWATSRERASYIFPRLFRLQSISLQKENFKGWRKNETTFFPLWRH